MRETNPYEPPSTAEIRVMTGLLLCNLAAVPVLWTDAEGPHNAPPATASTPSNGCPQPHLVPKETTDADYYAVDFMLQNPNAVNYANLQDQLDRKEIEDVNDEARAKRLGATVANVEFDQAIGKIAEATQGKPLPEVDDDSDEDEEEMDGDTTYMPTDEELKDRRDRLFAELLRIAHDKYHLKIEFLEQDIPFADNKDITLTSASLEDMDAQDVAALGYELFRLPSEYFQAAGLCTIKLYKAVSNDPTRYKNPGFADNEDAIWLDRKSPEALSHELGHKLDKAFRGKYHATEPTMDLLQSNQQAMTDELPKYTMNQRQAKIDEILKNESPSGDADFETDYGYVNYEQRKSKIMARLSGGKAKLVKFVSWYHTNSTENKAEMTKLLLRGYIGSGNDQVRANEALSPSTPVLFANLREMLARLYHQAPGATIYTITQRDLDAPISRDGLRVNPLKFHK